MSLFQLASDHQHNFECHPRREQSPTNEQNSIQPPSPQKKKPRRKVRIQTLPSNNPDQYFYADLLIPFLQESMQELPSSDFDMISEVRKDLQAHVYYSLVEDSNDYLNRIYKTEDRTRQYSRDELNELLGQIREGIMSDILGGQFEIHKMKSIRYDSAFNKGTQAAIKIREQLLKAKISDLKSDLTIDENNSSLVDSAYFNPSASDAYSPENPRTKKALQFVKKMRSLQQKDREEKKKQQYLVEVKKKQRQEQKRQIEERMKAERHEFLRHQFQQKRKQKQEERKHAQEQKQKFSQFFKEFKNQKPVYKKKQEQFFKNFVLEDNKRKLEILRAVKQNKRSISLSQVREHQKNYLQLKDDNFYESNAARAMQEKSRKVSEKKYYKSKYHSVIEKQQKDKFQVVDELQIKKKTYEKTMEYATQIKTKFAPKISHAKRMEIQKREEEFSLLQKIRNNKRVRSGQGCKNDGKDNLQKLHLYIAELKAKGKVKNNQAYRSLQMTPQHSRYKNYLQDFRQSGTSSAIRPRYQSIDYQNLAEKDAERTKFKAIQKEASAQRRQQYLQNLKSQNIDKLMEEKAKVDQDYLESARAKIALINKFADV